MPVREKKTYAIRAVDQALDILETLCHLEGDVSIQHLSNMLEMNKSSVFRLLATFEQRGYVEPAVTAGKYRIGLSAFETGRKLMSRLDLWRKAKPVMARLVRECDETVYLAVPRRQEVLLLDMVENFQQVQITPMVGRCFPLERISAGRIVLAYGSSPGAGREWEQIRHQGVCIDRDALGDGVTSLAVPLFNAQGQVAGCLCLAGPTFRFTEERVQNELLPRLRMAGQTASSRLGYLGYFISAPAHPVKTPPTC